MLSNNEALESRFLLSFASLNSHGVLSVAGTSKSDAIVVQFSGSKVQAILNGQTLSFNKTSVKSIWSDGFGGNDKLSNLTNLPSTLIGDAGNDTFVSGSGNDVLQGDQGNNTVDYSSRTKAITAQILLHQSAGTIDGGGGQQGESDTYSNINTIVGGSGNDSLSVQEASDEIHNNIQDTPFLLDGRGGNDSFFSNSFYSLITVSGGDGNDHFSYVNERNTLMGGAGDDFFTNDSNDDDAFAVIDGGSGFDTEEFGTSALARTIEMGPGVEKAISHNVNVDGNDLNNIIVATGSQGDVVLNGRGGNDSLIGGNGNDTLLGGAGDDTLDGGLGSDDLWGDTGHDTADYSSRGFSLNISLDDIANDGPRNHPEEVDNVHSDIDTVLGGSGNDLIVGSPYGNRLVGNGGNDTIIGGNGNDTLIGGAGNDVLDGKSGINTIIQ